MEPPHKLIGASKLNRRDFLKASALVSATAAAANSLGAETEAHPRIRLRELIDTNVTLSRWPFRRLAFDEPEALVQRLRRSGVGQAWVCSFDALLHKNISEVNERIAEDCRRFGRGILVPIGSVNPSLPGWEHALRQCARLKMRGIRLYPNYHGYGLGDPVFGLLMERAIGLGLIVQIALSMEDERTQHPLVRVPHVDASGLSDLLARLGGKVMVLNWWRALPPGLPGKLAATKGVFFDISTVENVGGLERLLKQIPVERIVFGSNAPLFYFQAAQLKLKESELTSEETQAITRTNALGILRR